MMLQLDDDATVPTTAPGQMPLDLEDLGLEPICMDAEFGDGDEVLALARSQSRRDPSGSLIDPRIP